MSESEKNERAPVAVDRAGRELEVPTVELQRSEKAPPLNPDLPDINDPMPPVPEECAEVWQKRFIEGQYGEKTMRGLRYWMAGYSWTEISEIMGYSDRTCGSLRHAARVTGLYQAMHRTDRILQQSRRIAFKAGEELEKRLDEAPEAFAVKELGISRGIEVDKISMHEGWRHRGAQAAEEQTYLGALAEVAKQITEGGGEVSLELKVSKRPDPQDVTPVVDVESRKP